MAGHTHGASICRTVLMLLPLAVAVIEPWTAFSQDDPDRLTPGQRAFVSSVPYSSAPIDNTSGLFDTRFQEAPFASIESIYMKPTVLTLAMDPAGDGRVTTVGDVHAVFPVTADALAHAIGSFGHYNMISHRTVFSVERGTSGRLVGYHKQVQLISATFLGIGERYLFATNDYVERLGGGGYGFRWNLERSYKNTFYELVGSWYLKPVVYDGTPCTYVRYYNVTGFTKAPPLAPPILEHFTASDYQLLLMDAFKVAEEIEKSSG